VHSVLAKYSTEIITFGRSREKRTKEKLVVFIVRYAYLPKPKATHVLSLTSVSWKNSKVKYLCKLKTKTDDK